MDGQLEKFYSACKKGDTINVERILNNLSELSEDEIEYIGKWGVIIACMNGHGRSYPMYGKILFTGQWLTEKFNSEAKCLHVSFLESRCFVESNNKFDHIKPKSIGHVKYNLSPVNLSACLVRETEYDGSVIRSEIRKRRNDFFKHKSQFFQSYFSYTMDEIFDKFVESKPKDFIDRSWKLVEKTNRSAIKACNEDTNHLYKFCIQLYNHDREAHFLRVPYGNRMKQIIEKFNLYRIKIVEESLICLKTREDIIANRKNRAFYFVVKSKIESIMTEEETAVFIDNLPISDQIDTAHQLSQLVCLSGFNDISLDNLRIDKKSKKLVIVDTEPSNEVGIGICLPMCLPVFHDVASVYGINS